MNSRVALVGAVVVATVALHPSTARVEVVTCDPDGSQVTATADSFHVYRPGTKNQHLRWRDIEFMADTTYLQRYSPSTVNAVLEKFASSLIDSTGFDAFNTTGVSRYRLLWDYLRRSGTSYDASSASNVNAVAIGSSNDPPEDRCHVDLYLVYPSRTGVGGRGSATFIENDEDRSTAHLEPLQSNTMEVAGPDSSVFADITGAGWTHPTASRAFIFSHEFQHKMAPTAPQGTAFDEMFSAGAEALARHPNNSVALDFPYTVSLLGNSRQYPGADTNLVRFSDSNYQGRSSFMAYLAYNFRGADSSSTLSGTQDDLMRLWSQASAPGGRDFTLLRDLLADSTCGTCAAKAYMPASMPNRERLGLVVHNWRTANYVNSRFLDEGQYGFSDIRLSGIPFSPWRHLGAWTGNDPYTENDINSIPPEVVMTGSHVTRSAVVDQQRTRGAVSYPMALRPFGSEYWVVRTDPSVLTSGQDLHVRVSPASFTRNAAWGLCDVPINTEYRDTRLWLSVVAYKTAGLTDTLWMHPEWAARVYGPTSVDVDSMRGPFDFFVTSLGDSFRAALVVITLGDGPGQRLSKAGDVGYSEWQRYQVEFALRRSPGSIAAPTAIAATPGVWESDPVWAPSGDTLAYSRMDGSVTQIYLKNLSSSYSQKLLASSKNQRAPNWSPRGDWLVFVERCATGQCEKLVLHNRVTQSTRTLDSSSTGATEIEAAFAPDGQRLAFSKVITFGGSAGSYVRRAGLYGQQDSILVKRGSGDRIASLRWSPDGIWVYFLANDSLCAVGATGAVMGKVVARSGVFASAAAFDLPVNDSRIAIEEVGNSTWYLVCGGDEGDEYHPNSMPFRRVALRDTALSDTIVTAYRAGASYYRPRLSPNGTRMAWSTNQDDSTDRDVYVGPVSWNHAPAFAMSVNDTTLENGPGAYIIRDWNATDSDGETPTFAVVGLPSGATFSSSTGEFYWAHPSLDTAYVVFRALDGSGGVDQRVVRYRAFPAVAPDTIEDLSPDIVTSTSMTLTWTAPGDDDNTGAATEYDIRWSPSQITSNNWATAYQLSGEPTPHTAGTTEFYETFSGLQPCTWYYIAIRARDEAHNWSEFDPALVLHARTLCSGGGSGGESANLPDLELGTAPQAATAAHSAASTPTSDRLLAIESVPGLDLPEWKSYFLTRATGDTAAISIQKPDAHGNWVTVAALADSFDGEIALGAATASARRYLFSPRFTLEGLTSAVAPPRAALPLVLSQATSSRLGDIASPATLGSGNFVDGDTVTAHYESTDAAVDADGNFAILSVAARTARTSARPTPTGSHPVAFALYQSQPNPFRQEVAIHYDLPVETRVRLAVHDIQGRLIRVLEDRRAPAGRHSHLWDRRGASGQTVAPGIYLYRLEAGTYRAQKKMVALP